MNTSSSLTESGSGASRTLSQRSELETVVGGSYRLSSPVHENIYGPGNGLAVYSHERDSVDSYSRRLGE